VRSTQVPDVARHVATIPPLLLLAACAIGTAGSFPSSNSAQAAFDVPVRFDPAAPDLRVTPVDTIAGAGCLSPLVDPRDGTRIILERSLGGEGDYRVPGEKYRVRAGEFLRIECNSGRVVGIVKQ
jgi:hypothetical protein